MNCETLILGKIITLDTDRFYAEAMACKDGRIVYIGSREYAERLCGKDTRVLDYGDNVIYPGFWDCHTHGLMAGQRLGFECDLTKYKSMDAFVNAMREYVEANPDKDYYLGSGWDLYSEPTAAMLDAICPDKPMVLRSVCGHMVWVNTAAMKHTGCDAEKAKKYGPSMIHVDANGNPSGLMTEAAIQDFVKAFAPTVKELKEGLLVWQDFAFKNGMTSVIEAYADMYEGGMEAYKELVDEGKWKLRTYAFPVNQKFLGKPAEEFADIVEQEVRRFDTEYFKVIGAKQLFDGIVDAHTANLIDEYADMPGNYGVSNIAKIKDYIREIIKNVNAKGLPVHIHTIGDAAVRDALDILDEAEFSCGNFDIRNQLCHLELVKPEDVKRFAELNVVAVVAPLWVDKWPVFFQHEVDKLGETRAYSAYPVRSFEDAGATITFHTDYPITPKVDIPVEIYQAIKRGNPNRGPQSVRNADEGISAMRAILALTANAAYSVNQENNLGTLAIGKIANAVVYDMDFLACDVKDIASSKLIATIIDGEEVYNCGKLR